MRTLLIPMLACAVLAGCATDGAVMRVGRTDVVSLESMIADAENSAATGQHDKAYATLKAATASFPADKAPWMQMAQMRFDRGSYGEAIQHALEGLQRDPGDRQGNSIVAVSGLRLSTRALADLSQQNNLGGSVRTEAQDLAKLLRASLGEEVLVPTSGAARQVRRPPPGKPAASPPAKAAPSPASQTNSADPFGALK